VIALSPKGIDPDILKGSAKEEPETGQDMLFSKNLPARQAGTADRDVAG
jgi:hypothetical protein